MSQQYMAGMPQDRLIRKEVALGAVRDIAPPTDHIGLTIAPFKEVETDEVIFDYLPALTESLAPARAEDAESEMAPVDDYTRGQGRASVIDWALKDHYVASDVSRYRDMLAAAQLVAAGQLPRSVTSGSEGFAEKLARDDLRRRRSLDNRIEWLIMSGLSKGEIEYDDGRISFKVDYGRPADQSNVTPASGSYASDTHDPINDLLTLQQTHFDKTGTNLTRAICSKKALLTFARSAKFGLRGGYVPNGSGGANPVDPAYLIDGWGPDYALDLLKNQTGIEFTTYDSVIRTRKVGTTTVQNVRFTPVNQVIFLPSESELSDFDDTGIGLGKTLTSPHPEGNWEAGFYEWEKEDRDPWGTDRGTGIKAFPVFLHLDKTVTMNLTLPA